MTEGHDSNESAFDEKVEGDVSERRENRVIGGGETVGFEAVVPGYVPTVTSAVSRK
jgi:hypothetical protein